MENEIKFLKEVIAAQEKLLICYRLGGQPPEWVFDKLSKAKMLLLVSKSTQQANPTKDLYQCPVCGDRILKPGYCHNPHCPNHTHH